MQHVVECVTTLKACWTPRDRPMAARQSRALVGEEDLKLGPKKALEKVGDGEYPQDLARQDAVFLLGEGRFEERKREEVL